MTLDTAPDVLNVVEAARLLRISRNGTYELIRGGILKSVRIGRRNLVPKAALLALLRESDDTRGADRQS